MKTLFLLPFIIFSLAANATDYYISSGGNDANNGTSTSTPWKTLNKLNSYFSSLKPGDNVLLNRGDVFYGSITINKSGTAGSPITIGAFGIGANPVITGFTTVSAWTNLGSNIWESTAAVSTLATCNMVTINGVNTPMGRYPNAGYLTFQSHSGTTSITSSSLTGTPNWTGAGLVVRSSQWTLDQTFITSQSGSTLTYNPALTYTPTDGFGYFIQNDSRTLDTANEWYYNPSTKKIQIYSTSSPTNVQVTTQDVLVTVHGAYITFDGLSFTGANSNAFYNTSGGMTNLNIQNCSILFSGIDAIKLAGCANFKIENSTILNSNNIGIRLDDNSNPYATIRNNTIQNTGVYPGMGQNGTTSYSGISCPNKGLIAEYNKVINTGYIGINFTGDSVLIKNNLIDTFCTIKQDGGGIYTQDSTHIYRKIIGNIVLNGIGSTAGTNSSISPVEGIYLDDNSKGVEVSNNSVANCANHGIFLHNACNFNIHDNTFYNNLRQFGTQHDAGQHAIMGGSFKNNIFFSKSASQLVGYFISNTTDIPSWGTLDSNYYARPIDDNLTFSISATSFATYTLAGWQTYSGFDAHSHKSPKTITDVNDLRFEYNATSSDKTISLDANYIDVTGKSYLGTITLAPFSSAVLIRNGAITNQPPKANAGTDQSIILPTNTVSLNGNGTDPDGSISAYNWTEISGPSAGTITNATSASTSVTGLIQGVYRFQLKATDNNAATALDTVQITVNAAVNIAPVAEAGANQMIVLPASNINIAGSGTDADGTVSSYNWTKISGPAATIVSPNSQSSSVTGLLIGSYKFQLTVTDNKGAIGKDSMQITVIESVLPLNLLTFKGQLVSSKVSLTWKTANEKNVSGFDIEKMTGNTWARIGFIQSASGSLAYNDYFFSDYLTVTGLNFYRLKIVDVDGKYVYSDIINVELKPNKNVVYQNVPNAFSGITTIRYEVADKALVKIMVFNGAGIQVADLANEIKQPGSYQIQWNAENILSGNYFYTVIIGDNVTTKKMLKIN